MKINPFSVLMATALAAGLMAGSLFAAETESEAEVSSALAGSIQADESYYDEDLSFLAGKKIGITIQSLGNAYWAEVMADLKMVLKENGAEATFLSCDDNSAIQIGQIETFIQNEVDLIMVHPSSAVAVEDVCKAAMDAGIKVMCWDDAMENADADWILDNKALGIAIGEMAGAFINEHYSVNQPAQVLMIGYPSTAVLLERAGCIEEGLKNSAPGKYEIVAEAEGIEETPVSSQVANILSAQESPDLKVVVGIGAGPMIGANQAYLDYYEDEIPEDVGIFTADITKWQVDSITSGKEAARGVVGFEGSNLQTANAAASMFVKILKGNVGAKIVYRQITPMTAEYLTSHE